MKIARYIKGLVKHKASQVDVSHYITFDDMCKLASSLKIGVRSNKNPTLVGGTSLVPVVLTKEIISKTLTETLLPRLEEETRVQVLKLRRTRREKNI